MNWIITLFVTLCLVCPACNPSPVGASTLIQSTCGRSQRQAIAPDDFLSPTVQNTERAEAVSRAIAQYIIAAGTTSRRTFADDDGNDDDDDDDDEDASDVPPSTPPVEHIAGWSPALHPSAISGYSVFSFVSCCMVWDASCVACC